MVKYILKRLGFMVIVFFCITVIIFIIYDQVPTDRVLSFLEGSYSGMPPEQYALLYQQTYERLGLDQPKPIQYIRYIQGLFSGDMGYSLIQKGPVRLAIKAPISATVRLNIINLILCFSITLPLGIRSAVKRGGVFDNTAQVITIIGYSWPTFITAILSIILFSVVLGWLPVSGMYNPRLTNTPGVTETALMLDRWRHMVLPLVVMVFSSCGGLTRYVRAAMIEALSMDCVRTARAKGLREKTVIYRHALRNAQITVITAMASWFITIFSGSVMIERIFLWNGMGNTFVTSVQSSDWALAFAFTMFYVVIGLIGYIIIDIVYAVADPRIRLT